MSPHPNNPSPANNAVPGLVAADMFTPGRAGDRRVLVWEGTVAAPASPLPWHSSTPVEVFFHTGHGPATQALPQEFTRQLDRQLSALSLLSVQRLLEGIRTYRTQGRQPNSNTTRKARKNFMKDVMRELVDEYDFSEQDAADKRDEINDALVVLHESDQVTFGPSQPGMSVGGYPSVGYEPVNSSVGSQGKPMSRALEEAAQAVPAERRAGVRILIRAVLTDSPELAKQLRNGQAVLEPRSQAQRAAISPRAPPWTPGKVAADIANNTTPWQPPTSPQTGTPPSQTPDTQPRQQPDPAAPTPRPSPSASSPGWDPDKSAALRRASFPHPASAALRKPPPHNHTPAARPHTNPQQPHPELDR
ncbi:polymorphic toxin type 15 domain-containing protein [Actinomyces succiniciruminis]|uniref:Putative toxin 43 n=1 Tax=Actinomyces succiniciruminis TaxID=1522002 RepID=A0A1L7R8H8_9ACTO|nr:polymorphic toxin type 15 domain-containing protein [Actinomyces succiniciruminis]CED90067.1 Putative toxin 43 [Actinomyces succiniciruminis]